MKDSGVATLNPFWIRWLEMAPGAFQEVLQTCFGPGGLKWLLESSRDPSEFFWPRWPEMAPGAFQEASRAVLVQVF